MAHFSYKAVDDKGQSVNGSVAAVDRRVAVSELAAKGHFVLEMNEQSASASASNSAKDTSAIFSGFKFGSQRITSKDVLAVTSQLSTALNAGLEIINALEIIAAQQTKPAMKDMLETLASEVSSGHSLSEAMEKYPRVFSVLYVSMIRVGETGGILEKTIKQLAELLGREVKIKSSINSALAYPMFVLGLGLVSVVIMLAWILPNIINNLGEDVYLPLPTRMLMGMSDFTVRYGWIVAIVIAVSIWQFVKWKRTKAGTFKWDGFILRVPIVGKVMCAVAVGRFARTLGALTMCGITILEALSVVRDTLGNEMLGTEIDEVSQKVRVGEPLAGPLSESGRFPPLLVQIVSIGEQTGSLDELLLNAADTFDEQADEALKRFMSLVPSILIIILGVVIAFIILAMLLPIVAMDLGGIGL